MAVAEQGVAVASVVGSGFLASLVTLMGLVRVRGGMTGYTQTLGPFNVEAM